MNEHTDVVVVGAGAVGAACAYELARLDVKVILLEREGIGSGASTHATGAFSQLGSHFFPSEPYLRLGIAGYRLVREAIPEVEELSGVRTLFQTRPCLSVALDEAEELSFQGFEPWRRELTPFEWISTAEARRLEPRLSPRLRGAALEREGAQIDAGRYTLALAQAAEELGARVLLRRAEGLLRRGDRVVGVKTADGLIGCDHVVLAMGPWAATATAWLGWNVPVALLWGERAVVRMPGPPLGAIVNSPKRGHLIWRLDDTLTIGSTQGRALDAKIEPLDEVPDDAVSFSTPTSLALESIMQRAVEVMPCVAEAHLIHQLAGYRPMAADRLPLIGPVPGLSGLLLAAGHGTKGIHLAQVSGRAIAEMAVGKEATLGVDLAPFSPARFGGEGAALG